MATIRDRFVWTLHILYMVRQVEWLRRVGCGSIRTDAVPMRAESA
jgi:hypothetical protein